VLGLVSKVADRKSEDRALPLVIDVADRPADLTAWLAEARVELQSTLLRHGGILFRGLDQVADEELETITALLGGEPMPYREKQTPRSRVSGNVFTATDTPPRFAIQMHSESAFGAVWPRHLTFHCRQPATEGGCTPIADSRRVYAAIDREVRERFERLGVMYLRNFGIGPGMSWRYAFDVSDEDELRAYCTAADIELEALPGGTWRTRQRRPAVVVHPLTGDKVWFNHAVALNASALDPNLQAKLRAERDDIEMPINTCYGDGTPISDEVIQHLREAYAAHSVRFDWRRGDVLVLDNLLTAHGRDPYVGERTLVAVPATATRWSAVSHSAVATTDAVTIAKPRPRLVRTATPPVVADLETRVLTLWREVLEEDDVSADDDFFEAGGDSILAADLVSAVEEQLGHTIALDDLYRAPTAHALAQSLRRIHETPDLAPARAAEEVAARPRDLARAHAVEELAAAPRERLLVLRSSGTDTPLFVAGVGAGERARNLARELDGDRPLYALFMKKSDPRLASEAAIGELADHYLAEVRAARPHGPYAFLGFCGQGIVLYEMARRLIDAGEDVRFLGLIESTAPGKRSVEYRVRRALRRETKRVGYHAKSIREAQPGQRVAYVRKACDTLLRRALRREEPASESTSTPFRPIRRPWEPAPYPRPLSLFNGDIASYCHDATLGWASHAPSVDVRQCSGRHLDMLMSPHVLRLAEAVGAALSAADGHADELPQR